MKSSYDGADLQPLRYAVGFPNYRMNERHCAVTASPPPTPPPPSSSLFAQIPTLLCSRNYGRESLGLGRESLGDAGPEMSYVLTSAETEVAL